MRAAWPAHKPLSVRLSGTDWHPDGLTDDDLIRAASLGGEVGYVVADARTGSILEELGCSEDPGVDTDAYCTAPFWSPPATRSARTPS